MTKKSRSEFSNFPRLGHGGKQGVGMVCRRKATENCVYVGVDVVHGTFISGRTIKCR